MIAMQSSASIVENRFSSFDRIICFLVTLILATNITLTGPRSMPKNAFPPAAVVAIITLERKFLVIKRSKTVRSPNQFCFPGGMIEVGETPQVALVREMSEELNIDVTPVKEVWASHTPKGTRLHWWTAKSDQLGRVFPNPNEVASFQWLEMDEINELQDVLVSNQKFFEAINAGHIDLDQLHS